MKEGRKEGVKWVEVKFMNGKEIVGEQIALIRSCGRVFVKE